MPRLSPAPSPLRGAGASDDGGFTIIEVVVAIAVVTIVMTSLAAFFVNSARATDGQSQRQTATQVATDAMEKARSLSGLGPLSQRDQATSTALWTAGQDTSSAARFPGVAPYLTNVSVAYDTTTGLAPNSGYTAPLPICLPATPAATCASSGATVSLDNQTFTRNWFIGNCWQTSAGVCTATSGTGTTQYLQVVVDVTWRGNGCGNNLCSYVSATLISPTPDPLFDAGQSAPKPKINNPGNQVSDVSVPITTLPITVAGGTAPLYWKSPPDGLPPGLTLNTSANPVTITGTPTTVTRSPVKVVLTVTDAFGFVSTAAFTWGVYAKPTLTNPGTQITTRNTAVTAFSLVESGGAPTLTYSATGLPTGLSIGASNGTISGTATTNGTYSSAVTVTDGVGQSVTASFTWKVVAAPSMTTASSYTTAENAVPSSAVGYVCNNGPCAISLTGSVPGVGLDTDLDNGTDNSAAKSISVPTGSGTVYLTGKVRTDAVSGTYTTSTTSYTPKLTITDDDGVAGTVSSSWTARTTPGVTWPGDVSVARKGVVARAFTLTCVDDCTVAVTGAPAGIGLATSSSSYAVLTNSLTVSGSGTYYLTGKASTLATLGTTTVTLTVTDVVSSTTYTVSSYGTWTVTS